MRHINTCFMKHKFLLHNFCKFFPAAIWSNRISRIFALSKNAQFLNLRPLFCCASIVNTSQLVQKTPDVCPHPLFFSSLRGGSPAWSPPVVIHIIVNCRHIWIEGPCRVSWEWEGIHQTYRNICIHRANYAVQIHSFIHSCSCIFCTCT